MGNRIARLARVRSNGAPAKRRPKGRPRRFDARFLLADATDLVSDIDDFSGAEDELSHLQWVKLAEAREFDLPFITQVVMAELMAYVRGGRTIESVPHFRNDDEDRLVARLGDKYQK